jgi:FkbM family methyltransferase
MARPLRASEPLGRASDQDKSVSARRRRAPWSQRFARSTIQSLYRVPWLASAVRSAVNLVVPDRLQEVRVAGGPLRGARLVVNLRAGKYWWLGTYEPWIQELLVDTLRPGMRAWDVGAFFGYHTLLMRRLAGPNSVVALEPDPENRAHLLRHLALNDARDVEVLPVAAGAISSRGRMQSHRVSSGNEVVPIESGGELDIVTLDSLLERHAPPDLVKVDVEGAESAVLAGAGRLIEQIRPTWIVELHSPDSAPFARFRRAGYRIEMAGRKVDAMSSDLPGGPVHLVARP